MALLKQAFICIRFPMSRADEWGLAHVYELDVVEITVCDGLIHLLVLAYPIPEVLQGLHSEQQTLPWLCKPLSTLTPQF